MKKFAIEIGGRAGEGRAYGNPGNACHWVTIEKPSSIIKNVRKFQKKSVIRPEKEERMEVSVLLSSHWKTIYGKAERQELITTVEMYTFLLNNSKTR